LDCHTRPSISGATRGCHSSSRIPRGAGSSVPRPFSCRVTPSRPDNVNTSIGAYEKEVKLVYRRQPSGAIWSSNPLLSWYFDWYFMRLEITITPTRILWWDHADISLTPREFEVLDVG
jgi:hypothetical protein